MKVLFYTHEFPPRGGIGTYSYNICVWLARLSVNVLALAPRYTKEDKDYSNATLRIIRFLHPRTGILKTCMVAPVLFRYAATFSPDVVIVTDPRAMYLYGVLSLFLWTRYVVVVHGNEILLNKSPHFMAKFRKMLQARVLKNADHVITISHYTERTLLKMFDIDKRKVSTIYHALDPLEFNAKDDLSSLRQRLGLDDRKVILTVANTERKKGADLVIRALPEITKAIPQACYVIAGSGPFEQELREMVKKSNLQDYVLFVGRVTGQEKLSYYRICDVFVMPSRPTSFSVESFGISFLEAGVMNRPVIGSRLGGIPEAVVHGKTGFLIEPEDVNGLAERIIHLLSNPRIAQEMGNNNREWVTTMFNWQKCAQKTLDVISRNR
jgi:phosphatidylinositol alpha-1,6-mannosyltransferase